MRMRPTLYGRLRSYMRSFPQSAGDLADSNRPDFGTCLIKLPLPRAELAAYKQWHALAKACRRDYDLVLVPLRGPTYLYPVGYQLFSRNRVHTLRRPMQVLGTGTLQKPQRQGITISIHTGEPNIKPPPFLKLEPRQRTDDAFCHVWVTISRPPGFPPCLTAAGGASEGNRTPVLSVEG